jgi:SH3-like domain-containing protein
MFGKLRHHRPANCLGGWAVPVWLRALLTAIVIGLVPGSAALAAADNPSGLPLPRFASTRNSPINVRVGPGVKYDVAWVYVKPGIPVEIVQEFDTWRRIRDVDGTEGWVQQNFLIGRRVGLVGPGQSGKQFPLLSRRADDSPVRAYLGPGYSVDIRDCDGSWCEVSATDQTKGGHAATYSGFLAQSSIWGAYPGEKFN